MFATFVMLALKIVDYPSKLRFLGLRRPRRQPWLCGLYLGLAAKCEPGPLEKVEIFENTIVMQSEKVAQHISQWLQDYAREAGSKGFVVGVSGGIDSAVTSTLAARTGLPVTCVEMPIHQHPEQVTRAQAHIRQLAQRYPQVQAQQVDLTAPYESLIQALPSTPPSEQREMSLVNTRARLRMTTLYYFAALEGKLVAGTGNKVEDFGVGFYTKYGDGGVDLSPIADLLKSEVYAMGQYLEVPQSILDAPPTDGLWGDNRTDEDQIGASYPELEWAMAQQEDNRKLSDFSGRKKEVFSLFLKHQRANLHKMKPIPVCKVPVHLKE